MKARQIKRRAYARHRWVIWLRVFSRKVTFERVAEACERFNEAVRKAMRSLIEPFIPFFREMQWLQENGRGGLTAAAGLNVYHFNREAL